jgi:hypothetical protein|tara:strand:+ start:327 stop:839 length:513 start_codon:yes stop_codon:yes gene_type:complete
METLDVKRGLIKNLSSEGGLAGVARKYFDNVQGQGDAFSGSHGIMSKISGEYNALGRLVVDVVNELPDFNDKEAMIVANQDRAKWNAFLEEATGYTSKQRSDKSKEWVKKASKAKSGINQARSFMEMATNLSDEIKAEAESLIGEIEAALEADDNTKAAGRAEKLGKLLG